MKRKEFLPYGRPFIDEDDISAVKATVANGWLTTGPAVREFEKAFTRVLGVKHAVALNSCTAGLHLGLLALGVGPGDEVIMPSLSFVAGANCTIQIGANPVFCDVDPETLCLSVRTIEPLVTDRTKVIMSMHYAGRPASAEPIVNFARARGIAVLEDAALAIGMLDNGKWAGNVSDAAVYSFYATKNVTSAEGGMFVTNNDELMEKIRILSLHGMDRDAWKRYERGGSWRYDIVTAGYKYNMPDLAAVLGIAQLAKLKSMQRRRDQIASQYVRALSGIPGVSPAGISRMGPQDRHSWCMFVISVDESLAGVSRDSLINYLRESNIGTSVHYIPSHLFSAYRDREHASLSVTERLWTTLISLPLYPSMSDADVEDVIDAISSGIPGSSAKSEEKRAGARP